MSSQLQGPRPNLNPQRNATGTDLNDTILVFILDSISHPRAESRWPETNSLLALPNENQTLCCERVLRQETSIVRISAIGDTEPLVQDSSSPPQLPPHSCMDAQCSSALETAPRLKDSSYQRGQSRNRIPLLGSRLRRVLLQWGPLPPARQSPSCIEGRVSGKRTRPRWPKSLEAWRLEELLTTPSFQREPFSSLIHNICVTSLCSLVNMTEFETQSTTRLPFFLPVCNIEQG